MAYTAFNVVDSKTGTVLGTARSNFTALTGEGIQFDKPSPVARKANDRYGRLTDRWMGREVSPSQIEGLGYEGHPLDDHYTLDDVQFFPTTIEVENNADLESLASGWAGMPARLVPVAEYDGNGRRTKTYDAEGYDEEGYDWFGLNEYGVDREGYDEDGLDYGGFDRDGIHVETGTDRDPNGYDRAGYDRAGYDITGFDRDGIDREGYNRLGFDKAGRDRRGLDMQGVDLRGFRHFDSPMSDPVSQPVGTNVHTGTRYDENGYDIDGYDKDGKRSTAPRDEDGYDWNGFDVHGIHRDTGTYRDLYGRDQFGYDIDGYDWDGYDEDGYDRDGYDLDGFNEGGYNRDGFDRLGRQRDPLADNPPVAVWTDGFGGGATDADGNPLQSGPEGGALDSRETTGSAGGILDALKRVRRGRSPQGSGAWGNNDAYSGTGSGSESKEMVEGYDRVVNGKVQHVSGYRNPHWKGPRK